VDVVIQARAEVDFKVRGLL